MNKEILLSGIKPTGRPHIGNYFGLMKRIVEMQKEKYQCMFFIADYHALNFIQDKEVMSSNILDILIDYLAIGFDPKKSIIFKQSDVSEHTELAWIFDTITTMAYLERGHAYKDAMDKGKEISVGTFNYPMLMASDILLYDTKVVPVGQDQKQHIEFARDTAEKFNRIFKEDIFVLPEAKILDEVAVVPGTDGLKMSKSYGNTIPLFSTYDEIKKAVMSIKTDSKNPEDKKNPEEDNIFKILKLVGSVEEIEKVKNGYENGGMGYKEAKDILVESLERMIKPFREKREQILSDKDFAIDLLKEGGMRAKEMASKKMEKVRGALGVKLY
jgi:tryptophanyl-tRNA synthetase